MSESLDSILARHRAGDPEARVLLMDFIDSRTATLVGKLLPGFPVVARWDRPSDIRQDAAIRLLQSLDAVKPESERHLINLAALQVQRVLFDKAREHARGGKGLGNVRDDAADAGHDPLLDQTERTMTGPVTYDRWQLFHTCVEDLPEPEREVFRMRWYLDADELTIANVLGISRSTVQRAYRNARAIISEKLG
jgi:RNA polymerase sigma factor (sigma-70 family)